jgi:carbon storage regulator
MIVLTKKLSERIFIGDNIIITVVRTGKNVIRIGIEVPEDVKVLREELIECKPGTAYDQYTTDEAETIVYPDISFYDK